MSKSTNVSVSMSPSCARAWRRLERSFEGDGAMLPVRCAAWRIRLHWRYWSVSCPVTTPSSTSPRNRITTIPSPIRNRSSARMWKAHRGWWAPPKEATEARYRAQGQ